jgi:hypothetical protein
MILDTYHDDRLCKVCWDTENPVNDDPCPACGVATHVRCSSSKWRCYAGNKDPMEYGRDWSTDFIIVCLDCVNGDA